MTTIADFVGTWYFRGYPSKPCYISLTNADRLRVTDEFNATFPAHLNGASVLVTENPLNWGLTGVLSSDAKRIAWSNGESWLRDHT